MDEAVVFLERGGSVGAGTQLGSRYVLGEQLGRGAMGVVYDATTTEGTSLAVKLLRPELASDDKTVARFVQERQIFRRIDHPNVVRVDDLVAEGDQLGIAMEKVTGGDLKQRAEARSLSPFAAMRIVADVAAGLEAIHAADVVHRDLKPANILLAETPTGLQPKISDFGISRLVSEAMTRTSTTIGTPLYMAPEAADKRGAEAPADIYALGAMMFELLIGTAPFHEGGTFAVLRAHAQDAPPFIGGVPTELAELIDHMLAKQPGARPTATEVRQRLLAIVPSIDDAISPIAIERVEGPGTPAGFESGAGSGGFASALAAAGLAGAAAGLAGAASQSAETRSVELNGGRPDDSAETRISSDGLIGLATPGHSNGNGTRTSSDSIPAFTPPSGAAGARSMSGPSGGTPASMLSTAGNAGGRAGGRGALLLNRLPRRSAEIGIAIASLAAVVAVIGFVATRGGDGPAGGIGSQGETAIEAGDGSGDSTPASGNQDAGVNPGGPGIFNGLGIGGDEGESDGERSATTASDRATSTTANSTSTTPGASSTSAGPTSTTQASTTSTAGPTSTTHSSTTQPSTTTTRPTTTTTQPTTTSSTAPAPSPIAIVSTPTVDSVGATSFHFNYTTNNVCGTGSFTVTEKASGTPVGSFAGQNVCYGPLHGGFPGHSSFPGFNIQPGTTYRVSISVKGTASDGTRPAGSGTAHSSFEVTTAG